MRLLLDTHVWLWLLTAPDRLRAPLQTRLAGGSDELVWSTVCTWEIAVKYRAGKLALPEAAERFVPSRIALTGATDLPIRHVHALQAAGLPEHHRDPFDRLLVAQAQFERLTLVSADRQLAPYEVDLLPA